MGLIEFVKTVGRKLGGENDGPQGQNSPRTDAPELKAAVLTRLIRRLGLRAGDLRIDIEGDHVTLPGKVDGEESREKPVPWVGDTEGGGRAMTSCRLRTTSPALSQCGCAGALLWSAGPPGHSVSPTPTSEQGGFLLILSSLRVK